ncbi:hypothetical protein Tco_0088165 [Tanacetum coccineum]
MPTEMELTLEQTQQGVSYEVSNIRVNSFTMKMEILLEPTSNKLMEMDQRFGILSRRFLLKLNQSDPPQSILTDPRLLKMVVEVPDSSYFRYSDTTHLSRSVEVLKLKKFQERCNIKAFQEWYDMSSRSRKSTRWQKYKMRRDCAWVDILKCSRSLCQIQVQGTSSIQEVNDHYNIFTRESQEYELKTKDKA